MKTALMCLAAVCLPLVPLNAVSAATATCATTCRNVQSGDNSASHDQSGASTSGSAVDGQVTGIVSSGSTTVDAKNLTTRGGSETGAADGANSAADFIGLNTSSATNVVGPTGATAGFATNVQDGDNMSALTQAATATSGDGIGGQVIGAVTASTGTAKIVADNFSDAGSGTSGNATALNDSSSFVGLNANDPGVLTIADANALTATNIQNGDNSLTGDQTAIATTGDGVGGQVIGAVTAGKTTINAKDHAAGGGTSGDATAANDSEAFSGLNVSSATAISGANTLVGATRNQQNGDNAATYGQTANAGSGDAADGQVIGVVTSVGGTADVVMDNDDDVEPNSGAATFSNNQDLFVGLNVNTNTLAVI